MKMRGKAVACVLAGAAGCLVVVEAIGASYSGKANTPPGAHIFDNKTVLEIAISLRDEEFAALQRNDRLNALAVVVEGGKVWRNVRVRIKGGPGSRRRLEDKASFTLNFNNAEPRQRFHGLRKIHLNNSVQDQSYMCESICGELHRLAGVPAARVSFATLTMNGKKKGLYVLKEGFTRDMLGLYFQDTRGNLYDGGFMRDIDEDLDNDGGSSDVQDYSDLRALERAARHSDPEKRWEHLNHLLDVERFVSMAAIQVMTWDWDGYVKNRNNYRVYHDLQTGKMVFFPHGMDQMFFYPSGGPFPAGWFRSIVADGLIKSLSAGEELYSRRFGEIFTNVFRLEMLTNRIDELRNLLQPHAEGGFESHVALLRKRIIARHAHLESHLATPRQLLPFQGDIAILTEWSSAAGADTNLTKAFKGELENQPTFSLWSQGSVMPVTWMTIVRLKQGRYSFEARARTEPLSPQPTSLPNGLSPSIRCLEKRQHTGTAQAESTGWIQLRYEFYVEHGIEDVTLVCELNGQNGFAQFDASSLRLRRLE